LPATLDTVEAAAFTQLETLLATASPAGPFAQVVRFASDTPRETTVPKEARGATPAILLAHERDVFSVESDGEFLGQGQTAFVATSTWRVFVIASELRGHDPAVKGSSTTGVYSLVSQVLGALAGLVIADLYQSERLVILDAQPVRVKPGEYVWLVRVSARYEVCSVAPEDESVDMTRIDGDINLGGTPAGEEPNPVTGFQASTED
jgi:hypothetical protein